MRGEEMAGRQLRAERHTIAQVAAVQIGLGEEVALCVVPVRLQLHRVEPIRVHMPSPLDVAALRARLKGRLTLGKFLDVKGVVGLDGNARLAVAGEVAIRLKLYKADCEELHDFPGIVLIRQRARQLRS